MLIAMQVKCYFIVHFQALRYINAIQGFGNIVMHAAIAVISCLVVGALVPVGPFAHKGPGIPPSGKGKAPFHGVSKK